MAKTRHKQAHYFQVIQLFAVVVFLVLAVALQDQINSVMITAVALVYFTLNIVHAAKQNRLDSNSVIEYGLIAIICQFLILNFVI